MSINDKDLEDQKKEIGSIAYKNTDFAVDTWKVAKEVVDKLEESDLDMEWLKQEISSREETLKNDSCYEFDDVRSRMNKNRTLQALKAASNILEHRKGKEK